jgi:hypothetical protein
MTNMRPVRLRGQSAMEYLMTYGWAILIIAVVLTALYSLGLFSGSTLTGTSCVASPGFLCSAPVLSHSSGTLSFQLGQTAGTSISNVAVACAATSNTLGYPNVGTFAIGEGNTVGYNGFYGFVSATGLANSVIEGNTILSGQTVTISNVICFTSTGSSLAANIPGVGTGFSGSIWIAYSTSGDSGPITSVAKVATINVKSS